MSRHYLDFHACLSTAAELHGDVCAGLTIGTRMAIAGLKAVGIKDPKGKDRKKLLVFVEIDRCATDAIMAITGCRPGKRTMKIVDYGKMAATFFNVSTGKAVRLVVKEKKEGKKRSADEENIVERYASIPDGELFSMQEVVLVVRPEDMPGKPLRAVTCDVCGERIMDMRERYEDGKTLCRPCAEKRSYYSLLKTMQTRGSR
jgi:formylmethanofuran dehydrogenase subunit E